MSIIANNLRLSGRITSSPTSPPFTSTTWSPTIKGDNAVLSNGDLTVDGGSGTNTGISVDGVSSGKYYWEVSVGTSNLAMVGIGTIDVSVNNHPGNGAQNDAAFAYYSDDGSVRHDGNTRAFGGETFTSGDIISVALDMDTGNVWFAKNGIWQGTGSPDPVTGTDSIQDNNGLIPLATALSQATVHACYGDASSGGTSIFTANFGATAFAHTVPAGFIAGFGN